MISRRLWSKTGSPRGRQGSSRERQNQTLNFPGAEVDGSAWAGGGERGGKLPGDAGRNRVDFRHAMYPVDTADLKAYALPPTPKRTRRFQSLGDLGWVFLVFKYACVFVSCLEVTRTGG